MTWKNLWWRQHLSSEDLENSPHLLFNNHLNLSRQGFEFKWEGCGRRRVRGCWQVVLRVPSGREKDIFLKKESVDECKHSLHERINYDWANNLIINIIDIILLFNNRLLMYVLFILCCRCMFYVPQLQDEYLLDFSHCSEIRPNTHIHLWNFSLLFTLPSQSVPLPKNSSHSCRRCMILLCNSVAWCRCGGSFW